MQYDRDGQQQSSFSGQPHEQEWQQQTRPPPLSHLTQQLQQFHQLSRPSLGDLEPRQNLERTEQQAQFQKLLPQQQQLQQQLQQLRL